MQKRNLGNSDIEVSVYCVGAWSFGGNENDYWGNQEQSEVEKIVHGALDMGVNFFDTAEGYNGGRSEESLGKALGARRQEAVIGTKIFPQHCAADTIRPTLEASLKRLGTDYVDLYMVHWPIRDYSVAEAFEALSALQREGKIRAIGVSNFGVQDLTEALDTGVRIDADQLHYSLLARAIEARILPLCRERGVAATAYMPLLQGILAGKWTDIESIPENRRRTRHFHHSRGGRHGQEGAEAELMQTLDALRDAAERTGRTMAQLALGWVASQDGIGSVIAGARDLDQLRANAEACDAGLDDALAAELSEASRPVFEKLGDNADYWQAGEDSRIR